MTINRGGKRPGAGRPRGSPNKATAAKAAEIAASGLTPLEYMLQVLRNEELPHDARMDAAYKAAPYVHPKRAQVDGDGDTAPTAIIYTERPVPR